MGVRQAYIAKWVEHNESVLNRRYGTRFGLALAGIIPTPWMPLSAGQVMVLPFCAEHGCNRQFPRTATIPPSIEKVIAVRNNAAAASRKLQIPDTIRRGAW